MTTVSGPVGGQLKTGFTVFKLNFCGILRQFFAFTVTTWFE
jgi:hypothetical protein